MSKFEFPSMRGSRLGDRAGFEKSIYEILGILIGPNSYVLMPRDLLVVS